MILAQPPQHNFSVNTASGKSDPQTEGQIDSLRMALNLSVSVFSVNMHILLGTKLLLSFSHQGRNPPVLVRFFLDCELYQNVCFLLPLFYLMLQLTSHVSCLSLLGTERLPWSTWSTWRACKYLSPFHRCLFPVLWHSHCKCRSPMLLLFFTLLLIPHLKKVQHSHILQLKLRWSNVIV